MSVDNSILVKKFCLSCKKAYCNGNCEELKQHVKELINNKIISRRGRPLKKDK